MENMDFDEYMETLYGGLGYQPEVNDDSDSEKFRVDDSLYLSFSMLWPRTEDLSEFQNLTEFAQTGICVFKIDEPSPQNKIELVADYIFQGQGPFEVLTSEYSSKDTYFEWSLLKDVDDNERFLNVLLEMEAALEKSTCEHLAIVIYSQMPAMIHEIARKFTEARHLCLKKRLSNVKRARRK